jgi:NAD(P)H-nitrite reductase large subunit
MSTRYVIVGNGAAGATAAETIRERDPRGYITIVSGEPYPMYSRPGLAYVIINEVPFEQIIARTPQWYDDLAIQLVFGRATGLDVRRRELLLEDGRRLGYDKLLIATGARAREAPYAGADLEGVVYLDTMDSTRELLRRARRGKKAVVIGGGITALEMTEGLAQQGVETHYFLRRDRLWSKVFTDEEAALLEEKMRHHGVHIHYNTDVSEILGNRRGRVRAVRLKSGEEFPCDIVGVGIGVIPQIDLAQDTPIATDRGILVSEYLQSSVRGIFAAGDCAQVYDRWSGRHLLDSLWPGAVATGRSAAINMTGGAEPYEKGTPFNACLLFGLHITAIGQVNPRPDAGDQHSSELSRGSSEVWFTFPRSYRSAWNGDGPNTIRLTLEENRLAGALIIGNQALADPLRDLIGHEVDPTPLLPAIEAGGPRLKEAILDYWRSWRSPEVAQ